MKKLYLSFFIFFTVGSVADWEKIGQDIEWEYAGSPISSKAINADGTIVAVASSSDDGEINQDQYPNGNGNNFGRVRIFQKNGLTWTQLGESLDGYSINDMYGSSISLNADGTILAIGAPPAFGWGMNSGLVEVFQWNGSSWSQLGNLISENTTYFGGEVSLNADGTILAIGGLVSTGGDEFGPFNGIIAVYNFQNGNWNKMGSNLDGTNNQRKYLRSLSADGSRFSIYVDEYYPVFSNGVVTATSGTKIRVYEWNGASWDIVGDDIQFINPEENHLLSVLNSNGTMVAISDRYNDDNGNNSGKVQVYEWNEASWEQLGDDINGITTNQQFGSSISFSADRLAVTSIGETRTYEWSGTSWVQVGDYINQGLGILSADGSSVVAGNSSSVSIYSYNPQDIREINGGTYTIGPNQTYLNADFSYADFSGVDFSGSTFTNCNLNHVSFNSASLIGTVFSYDRTLGRHDLSINLDFDNANLSGAAFINVDLHNQLVHQGPASFVNAILIGMTLYNYHMDTDPLDFRLPNYYTFIPVDGSIGIIIGPYVNLSGQDLTSLSNIVNNVDLRGLPAWGVNLSDANLSDLHIPGINFTGANFQNSIFNNTIMSNSTLQYCDFTGAVLNNANISHSDQGFAKYNNASMSNVYIWSCYLGGTDFTGADINGIHSGSCGYTNNTPPILPSGYILRNGHIVGPNANLTDATFNNFSFVDQDFSGANLTGVNFRYATLSNANFAGAILLNANLYNSDLSNANLAGADIRGANLTRTSVTLTASEMAEFDLSGANITGTALLHVVPDQSNSDQVGLSTENLTLSKIGNELQIYWDGAINETYQLFYSTNGVNWNSYAPTTCEWDGDSIVGREIATSEEASDRLVDSGNQYEIIRMAVAHSMESMTNAPVIMFKVESAHATEFN